MILVIDIGNTTVCLGGVDVDGVQYSVHFTTKMDTVCYWDTADYTVRILRALHEQKVKTSDFSGVVISSVVPKVLSVIYEASCSIFCVKPLVIHEKIHLGISLDVSEPDKVGKDRLVDSAWAAAHYPLPVVTADLGTATTLNVILRGGIFIGGVISAGMDTGLKALASRTAQLPKLKLRVPNRIIGKNTEECMISGAVMGTAGLLDGLVAGIEEELGEQVTLVITGGGAGYVDQLIRHPHVLDENMILKGLAYLYVLNCGKEQSFL